MAKTLPEPTTGYLLEEEDQELLEASCLDFDMMQLEPLGDVPDTRGIKDKMERSDQGQVSSCTGFGLTHAAEVSYFNATQQWRQFHPMWSYHEGQKESNIRGDRGATIHGVVKAAKKGMLPEDWDNDGTPETVYRPNYRMTYPDGSRQIASQWRVGYSIGLRTFDAMLRFLQTGQGAIITGESWGGWRPNSSGIVTTWRRGGGGHACAIVDWITIRGVVYLVHANSHGSRWGDRGFAYLSRKMVDARGRDRSFTGVGISDLKYPEVRRVVKVDEWNRRAFAGGLPRPY